MTKDEMQNKAVDAYMSLMSTTYGNPPKVKGKRGLIVIPARVGKTRTAGLIVQRMKSNRTAIVVPNDTIRDQWIDELCRLGINNTNVERAISIFTKGEVLQFASTIVVDFLIIDEAHKYLGIESEKILQGFYINYNHLLLLTATPVNGLYLYAPVVFEVTLQQAKDEGWIVPTKEYNYGISFSTVEEQDIYNRYTEHMRKVLSTYAKTAEKLYDYAPVIGGTFTRRIFPNDYSVMQACQAGTNIPGGKYLKGELVRAAVAASWGWERDLDLSIPDAKWLDENFNPNILLEQATIFNEIVRKRNTLINCNPAKLSATIDIIKKFPYDKIIVFSQSTDFANELNERLNKIKPGVSVCFHSKIASRPVIDPSTGDWFRYKSGAKKGEPAIKGAEYFKTDAIGGMRGDRYRILCTVASANEGLDIPDLGVAIITSGDCDPIKDYQRKARAQTIDQNNPDKLAYIFNVYIDDWFDIILNRKVTSRDLAKLQERQKNPNVVTINNLAEII